MKNNPLSRRSFEIPFNRLQTGLIGEILNEIHPLVESNKESILIQLLTLFGNCLGRGPKFIVSADEHYCNLFSILVGQSSRGRKGVSLGIVKSLFQGIDDQWLQNQVVKGLSSGEGLIARLDDKATLDKASGVEIITGQIDKRLICLEPEFSSVLRQSQREGNILSQILRDAWDSTTLSTLTKLSPLKATNPMISVVGHITIAELTKYLNSTEIANGLGNRFIFIKAAGDKLLPIPKELEPHKASKIRDQISNSVQRARTIQLVPFSPQAENLWEEYYYSINHADPTIVGSLTAREEAQVRRLSMIITLLNQKEEIDADSLNFAIEIFKYSKETLLEIYGRSFGDSFTDKVVSLLASDLNGLSRSQLTDAFSRNYSKGNLERTLSFLKTTGIADYKYHKTNGRPSEIWYLIQNQHERNEISPP